MGGSKTSEDFTQAMMSFIQSKEWMNRPDATELDRELFSEFWAQFFNIFKKLDKNGDQEITIPEALKWFQDRAIAKGMNRDKIEFSTVSNFFKGADVDDDSKLTIVEFFVNSPAFKDTVKQFDQNG